ncbi:hypothetical protein BDV95DRAFT_580271 [Massariosphaeria phaeospora]|uniref:Uncharacterized protein n=1 Tax=Massariosphaeria phaeospora TaxID=100035 RepID=A0A7C8I613_9PLEO|nr:hypothetical protein BDV95DRAFT_580271 [Massariosphaeria phaeospora]
MQRQVPNLDDFEEIAMNIPELSGNLRLVMSGLFQQLADHVRPKGNEYSGPWMLRADGRESDWARNKEPSLTVTSLSFPYFKLSSIKGHEKDEYHSQYPFMSLHQWQDRTDASRHCDMEQSYSQLADIEGGRDQSIYIPHVWVIIAGNVIFTYGPVTFEELAGKSIKQKAEASKGPDTVHITDLAGCLHILDMRECGTYFVSSILRCRIYLPTYVLRNFNAS